MVKRQAASPTNKGTTKPPKIKNESTLYFIGEVLNEAIEDSQDTDLENLDEFKEKLAEVSKKYTIVEDENGDLEFRDRKKGEPEMVVEANFIKLTNNQFGEVGVNYSIAGINATAASTDITTAMNKLNETDEYTPSNFSFGNLCKKLNIDKDEEESRVLEQFNPKEKTTTKETANKKGVRRTAGRPSKESNDTEDISDADEDAFLSTDTDAENTKSPSSTKRKGVLDRLEETRTGTTNNKTEINEEEENTIELDELDNTDEEEEIDELDSDDVVIESDDFDEMLEEVDKLNNKVSTIKPENPTTTQEQPEGITLIDIAGNPEANKLAANFTSAGSDLNGLNEIGITAQTALLISAIAGKVAEFITDLLEQAKEQGLNKELQEIIKLAESTNERINEDNKRLEIIREVETPEKLESKSRVIKPKPAARTTAAPETPSEEDDKLNPTATSPVEKLAQGVGLEETPSNKLNIDEKASVSDQLKQIKDFLQELNGKLDKIEERLDKIEEKLGISKTAETPDTPDPLATFMKSHSTRSATPVNGTEETEKLINYAKAMKDYATENSLPSPNPISLEVGENIATIDFKKDETTVELENPSHPGSTVFSASQKNNKITVTENHLTNEQKKLIAKLPQTQEEIQENLDSELLAKALVTYNEKSNNPACKMSSESGESYTFKINKQKNGSTKVTGSKTNDESETPVFKATVQKDGSLTLDQNEIPGADTENLSKGMLKHLKKIYDVDSVIKAKEDEIREEKPSKPSKTNGKVATKEQPEL